jgi:hypothetical protein
MVSTSNSIGISNPGDVEIGVMTDKGPSQVEVVCSVAGAINYPSKLTLCCTGCVGAYNLTLYNDTTSRAFSLPFPPTTSSLY